MSFKLEFVLENDTKNIIVQSNKRISFFKSELDYLFYKFYHSSIHSPAGWTQASSQPTLVIPTRR